MNISWRHHFFAMGVVCIFLWLHFWWRWQLVSFVPWPIALSLFIACTYRNSVLLLLAFVVLGEFFSWLPPGILTTIVVLPYVTSRLLKEGVRLWSPRLWLVVMLSASLQILISVGGYLWGESLNTTIGTPAFWMTVPWWLMGGQLLSLTLLVSLAVGIWHEVKT